MTVKKKIKDYKPKDYKWFIKRIGKRIYRDDFGCCKECQDVARFGIVVANKDHATYMADVDSDFAHDGIYLNYRDEK